MAETTKRTTRPMTRDLILAATTFPRHSDESVEHYLARITHVHLQHKKIGTIRALDQCKKIQVLYLYDNYIEVIENLSGVTDLKYLFLQNNYIKVIPTLTSAALEKLRLDENEISIVEGLEELRCLEELSIANQRIPSELRFDSLSMGAISQSLRVLDVSGNQLTSISQLLQLENLEKLVCADNNISELSELENIRFFVRLVDLTFRGNPVCRLNYRYRDIVCGLAAESLRLLDDVPITSQKLESIRAMQIHRKKVEVFRERQREEEEGRSQRGDSLGVGLDSKRTVEDVENFNHDFN